MLDWSSYRAPISAFTKIWIENLFYKLDLSPTGVCHDGGNNSHAVIECSNNISIKIFNYNPKDLAQTFNNCKTTLDLIYQNPHIQKTYKIVNTEHYSYAIQEWFNGKLLRKGMRELFSISDVMLIPNQLFLNIIIPLWNNGLIWKVGTKSNVIITDKKEVKIIDTDNFYRTLLETEKTPSNFTLRNHIRRRVKAKHESLVLECLLAFIFNKPIYSDPVLNKLKKDISDLFLIVDPTKYDPVNKNHLIKYDPVKRKYFILGIGKEYSFSDVTPFADLTEINDLKKVIDKLFLILDPIYHDPIDDKYLNKSISCYNAFEKELVKLFEFYDK